MSQISSLKFPHKLFRIVSECKSGCIQWTSDGDSVLIYFPMFQKQYLSNNTFFKTHQMSSFVRSLNIYGFEKQRSERAHIPGQNEYRHNYFLRDYPSYLDLVTRKAGKAKTIPAKAKSVHKPKTRGRRSNRKRPKLFSRADNCENVTEVEGRISPNTDNVDSLPELEGTWLKWMKDVDVKKEDLETLVKEEERYINFNRLAFNYMNCDETRAIGAPLNVLSVPSSTMKIFPPV